MMPCGTRFYVDWKVVNSISLCFMELHETNIHVHYLDSILLHGGIRGPRVLYILGLCWGCRRVQFPPLSSTHLIRDTTMHYKTF